jgi:hypothetical protein
MQMGKLKKLIISLLICLAITALIIVTYYPSQDIPGNLFVITILIHFTIFLLGALCLFLRVVQVMGVPDKLSTLISPLSCPDRFLYIFSSVGNTWMGIASIVLHLMGRTNLFLVKEFLPNLLVGVILLGDVFLSRTKAQTV